MRLALKTGSLALILFFNGAFATTFLTAYREGNYGLAKDLVAQEKIADGSSLFSYANMSLYGYGVLRNNEEAVKNFQLAAEKKDIDAILWMAKYNLSIKNNPEEAFKWFKIAALQNNLDAQLYVVGAYTVGYGTNKNEDAARSYYIAAARAGNPLAQYTLAKYFLESKHLVNQKLGISWLNKALEKDSPEAQLLYGKLLLEGKLVEKNVVQANEYIRKALAQDYAPAFRQMGILALEEQKLDDARAWFSRAVKAKVSDAEVDLANFYLQHKEEHKGYLVLLKAALSGSKLAQIQLASLYEKGIGIEADKQIAQQWLNKAKQAEDVKNTEAKLVSWLTHGRTRNFNNTKYRLGGILQDWNNKEALKENIYNKPPKLDLISKDEIFKLNYDLIKVEAVPLSVYYNTWAALSAEIKLPTQYPQYEENTSNKDLSYLKKRAEVGDPVAQFNLGLFYQHSQKDQKNSEEALKYLKLAALQQELRAQYQLALLYLEGAEGVAQDKKQAVALLKDAALKGNEYAQTALARLYMVGLNEEASNVILPKDLEEATSFYYLAAANGYGEAKYELANLLLHQKEDNVQAQSKKQALIEELYKDAFDSKVTAAALPLAFFDAMSDDSKRWQQAFIVAEQEAAYGNESAKLLLALLYDRGIGVDKDSDKAYEYYKMLPDNPVSNFILGTYAIQNEDLAEGTDLLQKSADAGFAAAYFNLAMVKHSKSEDFLPDLERAFELGNTHAGLLLADYAFASNNDELMKKAKSLYEKLANSGSASAQLKMGYIAEHGLGSPVDINAALNWYTLAASQDLKLAQYLLGNVYQQGLVDNRVDVANAEKWYKASGAFVYSQLALGFMAETVESNYGKARFYYNLAAEAGNKTAAYNLGLIYEYGKGIEVDEALAKDWFEKAN